MSRINDLIAEHCPGGVAFLPLAEVFNLRNGYTPPKSNAEFWADGTVPWFRMKDIRENGRVLNTALQHINQSAVKGAGLFPANSILIATSATIGEHALITVPHLSNQRFTSLSTKPALADRLNMKFAYFVGFALSDWCRANTSTSSFASVDMQAFRRFSFPLPPLEVQDELVRIFEAFTELEADLEAELKLRRQQYEFYRDSLLSFETETPPPMDPTE